MSRELKPAMKVTVFVGGDERHKHRPLYEAVIELLRESGVAGATVTKGVMGYGCRRRIHSDLNEVLMENLPLVIEAVAEEEQAQNAASRVAELLGEHGLVELHRTAVVGAANETNGEEGDA